MAIFEHGSVSIEVDEDGFMQEPEKWNEEVAAALGTTEGVDDLTDDHWKVVNYLRDYYLQFGVAPMIRKLCKQTGFQLKEIYELFPSGPAKAPVRSPACRNPRAACNSNSCRTAPVADGGGPAVPARMGVGMLDREMTTPGRHPGTLDRTSSRDTRRRRRSSCGQRRTASPIRSGPVFVRDWGASRRGLRASSRTN